MGYLFPIDMIDHAVHLGGLISAWIYCHFQKVIWHDWKYKFIREYRKHRPLDRSTKYF